VLLAVLVGAWLVAAALSSRRLATGQLVGLLVLGQVVVHTLSPSASSGHDLTMLLAHVAGTAISAGVLRRGEDALWSIADRLVLRFARPLAVVPVAPGRVAVLVDAWAPSGTRRLHDAEERGPPVGAC
jgi:hypothetical protein